MLHLAGEVFTKGGSRFEDNLPEGGEGSAKIFVKVIPGDLPVTIFAQLDTGAPWSIFDPEIAHALGVLDTEGEHVRIATRLGDKEGKLVRIRVTLPADVGLGVSLGFEATVFVTTDWPIGRNFIGYGGFVQGIRMALDPQNNVFYFGSY